MEAILSAARSMEEVFYKRGEVIIQQDEIGDSFYVLEEGLVSVTVSTKHFCKFSIFKFSLMARGKQI